MEGLSGKTELDKARADMIVDCIEDVDKPLAGLFSDQLEEAKKVGPLLVLGQLKISPLLGQLKVSRRISTSIKVVLCIFTLALTVFEILTLQIC